MTPGSPLKKPIILPKTKTLAASTAEITLHEESAQDYVETLFAFSAIETINYTNKALAINQNRATITSDSPLHQKSAQDYIETLFAYSTNEMIKY